MISVSRVFTLLALLAAIAPASADESSCPAPGITSRWVMALCFARFETDDPAHPGVSECFMNVRVPHDNAVAEDCETNLIYKTAICTLAVERGRFETVSACVQSRDATPRVVTDGIG